MSRVGGEQALWALPPPPPPAVLRCSRTPPSWLLHSEMDLLESTRGSLSRSTLLLRESILKANWEGSGEGRTVSRGGYRPEERPVGKGEAGTRGWPAPMSQQGTSGGDWHLQEEKGVVKGDDRKACISSCWSAYLKHTLAFSKFRVQF